MMTFRFLYPHLLWLLLLLPLFAFWRGRRGGGRASVRYPSVGIARIFGGMPRSRAGWIQASMRLAALACMILALARPQWGKSLTEIQASGIDIALVVDISGSMAAMDLSPDKNRLEVVKSVVTEFIENRPSDRIGLIAFSGTAYVVSPLTLDHAWLDNRLVALRISPRQDGTAIGSGIAAGINRLRRQKAKSKIMILLTDGVNNAGKISPITAAEAAHALGVKVYTIGAGSDGSVMMPAGSGLLGQIIQRRMRADIDEPTLKHVAELTGGKYFRATDASSLRQIYTEIDTLEKTERTFRRLDQYRELFHYFLIPGFGLLLLEILILHTFLRRLP